MNKFEFGLLICILMVVFGGLVSLTGIKEGVFISVIGLVPLFIGALTFSFNDEKNMLIKEIKSEGKNA